MNRVDCGSFLSSIWGFLFRPPQRRVEVVQKSAADTISADRELLRTEMAELRGIRDDTLRKLADAEAQRAVRRTDQINAWVEKVDVLEAEVAAELLIASGDITGASQHNFLPRLDQIRDRLDEVRELKSHRSSITRLTEPQDAPEDAVSAVERVLADDDGVGIVGIHGPPGIGKTTLLKKLRKSQQQLFSLVILADVSRHSNILKLQEALMEGASMFEDKMIFDRRGQFWLSKRYAKLLREALSKKRFLLLLDNVWEMLDLASIGIPTPDDRNKSKIVLTTSETEVCSAMGAGAVVEANRLDEARSWELFRRKVGAGAAPGDPLIRPIAEAVVAHCGGLPLALITVGRAMAGKMLRTEWEHAAAKLAGMDKSLISALKFSYDSLIEDKTRSCLLYCYLFPKSSGIDKERLVEYWIGEGFLDGGDYEVSLHVARNRGHSLLRSFLSAGLLEAGHDDEEKTVMLPDVVWDMVSSLTGPKSDGKNRFVTLAGEDLDVEVTVPRETWAEATRASLIRGRGRLLFKKMPSAPRLLTLLMNDSSVLTQDLILSNNVMPALTVLDLSGSHLYELPPSIGDLKELRFLNLSRMAIKSLPLELGKLTNLRQLDLTRTSVLTNTTSIPWGPILPLRGLQLLNTYMSRFCWCDCPRSPGINEDQGVEDRFESLEAFERLDQFGLNLQDVDCLNKVLNRSPRLRRSLMFLELGAFELTTLDLFKTFQTLTRLREISLAFCPQLEKFVVGDGQLLFLEVLRLKDLLSLSEIVAAPHSTGAFLNLRRLDIHWCPGLRNIAWADRLPSLEDLHLSECNEMRQLTESVDEEAFPKLKVMDLYYLPKLRCFSCCPRLLLMSMERLKVKGCPKLKALPFGPDSAKKLKFITGEQAWWDKLKWDREQEGSAIKATLESHFWPSDSSMATFGKAAGMQEYLPSARSPIGSTKKGSSNPSPKKSAEKQRSRLQTEKSSGMQALPSAHSPIQPEK